MHPSRSSLSLATMAVMYSLSASASAAVPLARINTDFDSGPGTAVDPLHAKFTALSITDDAAGPGAAITDGKKPDGSIDGDGTEQRVQQMQQAENAGATSQADAIETGSGANKAVLGDPPNGTEQQS